MPDMSLFTKAYDVLCPRGLLKIFVAVYQHEIIAIRLVLCHRSFVYDWYTGASDNHLDKYPNDFLPWKIMEWGSLKNYNTFDFGGAGKPFVPYGVRDYKLKFGGKLVEFGRLENIHNPILLNIGKFGLFFYRIFK
jgi:lipid II:glycine glycyltransferase (peptidoglycan interpeptide bridge formation enzyme)